MQTSLKYLTKQEIRKLFSVIVNPRDRAIFRIAYFKGLRASEVGALQLSSFNPAEGRLMVERLKGSLSSDAELSPQELQYLKAWLRDRGQAPGPLFPSNRKKGISRYQLHVLMRKYCALAGISREKAHMHVLKHSFAMHLLRSGADLYTVKRLLGHRRITSTEQYIHMADNEIDQAARKFHETW
jgi:site-specific recombinase XerD